MGMSRTRVTMAWSVSMVSLVASARRRRMRASTCQAARRLVEVGKGEGGTPRRVWSWVVKRLKEGERSAEAGELGGL